MIDKHGAVQETRAVVLTARESAVARKVVLGYRNSEIADAMGISEGTVKTHLHSIYKKLRITSRLQLALMKLPA